MIRCTGFALIFKVNVSRPDAHETVCTHGTMNTSRALH
jgi:hypothetical protein